MKWLTKVEISNYKAFSTEYKINIPFGSGLLIYGENGSGKSSLYYGLKNYFSSSVSGRGKFEKNIFNGSENGHVKIQVSENNTPLILMGQEFLSWRLAGETTITDRHEVVVLANKVKGFLDYKQLLKLYGLDFTSSNDINLFDLLLRDLMSEHSIPDPQGGVTSVPLFQAYYELSQRMINNPAGSNIHEQAKEYLSNLNREFNLHLRDAFTISNRFLRDYFKNKIELDYGLSEMGLYPTKKGVRKKMVETIQLNVKYASRNIEDYNLFLNEARLSALSVCIFLGSIKSYNIPDDVLKVLYLDDIFIGLDMSNRIPLLNILKQEFIANGFQVFISTYDRQWFEAAKIWFESENCKFKCLELFVNDYDGNSTTPDVPVVIDPSDNLFESAVKHFEAKDFPAAANYLRRTCEAELRRILPQHLTLNINLTTGEQTLHKLEKLVDNFLDYLAKNGLNAVPFTHFKTYKKIIFNPLSHDDRDAPHYRKEIQDGIDLVKELQKIKIKEILTAKVSATKPMKLGMRDARTARMYSYEIVVLENLQIIQQDMAPIKLSVVECEVIEAAKRKFTSLQLAFDALWVERGNAAPTNNTAFHNHIKVSNRRHLIDLMHF